MYPWSVIDRGYFVWSLCDGFPLCLFLFRGVIYRCGNFLSQADPWQTPVLSEVFLSLVPLRLSWSESESAGIGIAAAITRSAGIGIATYIVAQFPTTMIK